MINNDKEKPKKINKISKDENTYKQFDCLMHSFMVAVIFLGALVLCINEHYPIIYVIVFPAAFALSFLFYTKVEKYDTLPALYWMDFFQRTVMGFAFIVLILFFYLCCYLLKLIGINVLLWTF